MCLNPTTRVLQALAPLKEYALGQLLMKKRSGDEDDHTALEEQVVEDDEDQEGEHQQ